MMKLKFIKPPIMFVDFDSKKILSFTWKCVSLRIYEQGFKNVVLLNTDKINPEFSGLLFIPSDSVNDLSLRKFKKTSSLLDLDHQFKYNEESIPKSNGFIFPIKYLEWTYFENIEYDILDQLKENYIVTKEILNAKHVDLPIIYFDHVFKINELFSNGAHINYSLNDQFNRSVIKNIDAVMSVDFDLIQPKFSKIQIDHKLSANEFKLVWSLLCSRRTRFSISFVDIWCSLLSECLSVLSLCGDCPELASIYLTYTESDLDHGLEVIKKTIKNFKHKFGFITVLEINKHED